MEVIYSIKPKYVNLILMQKKNHEFRSKLPKNVPDKILVYTTIPQAEIRYILEVGKPIDYPNKITENGVGNKEFNSGTKKGKYAYPIIHLYELEESISLKVLKEEFDFNAPQSFCYLNNNAKLKDKISSLGSKIIF